MDKSRKKEKYRFFEALNILHHQDVASGATTTGNVGQCLQLIEARMHRGGCAVTMGAPAQELAAIHAGDKIPVLVLIDRKAYEELQYPKPEPYEPKILIDEDLGAWDIIDVQQYKYKQLRKAKDILLSFISSSKDRDRYTEVNRALNNGKGSKGVKALTVVRFADRSLEIHITLMDKTEHKFEIDF